MPRADDIPTRAISGSDLSVTRLSLGTNLFGSVCDKRTAFAVLDAYVSAGGNFIDTADVYPGPADGKGVAETIIGEWLRARGCRERVVLATKVGGVGGLTRHNIVNRVSRSMARLQTDYLDICYAHVDDLTLPVCEPLNAFGGLVASGAVRYIGASNFGESRLAQAAREARCRGLPRYIVLQTEYNLVERAGYETRLRDTCAAARVDCVAYRALAGGFLTGKYRPGRRMPNSPRASFVARYLGPRTLALVREIDAIAAELSVSPASVALAWTCAQPTVASAAVSARSPSQVADLVAALQLDLHPSQAGRLTTVSGEGSLAVPSTEP